MIRSSHVEPDDEHGSIAVMRTDMDACLVYRSRYDAAKGWMDYIAGGCVGCG